MGLFARFRGLPLSLFAFTASLTNLWSEKQFPELFFTTLQVPADTGNKKEGFCLLCIKLLLIRLMGLFARFRGLPLSLFAFTASLTNLWSEKQFPELFFTTLQVPADTRNKKEGFCLLFCFWCS